MYTRRNTGPDSALGRGPRGNRRFGSRARPIRAPRQARGPRAGPVAEGRPASASIPWSDASGGGQVGLLAARYPATPRGRTTVRPAGASPGCSLPGPVRRMRATGPARPPADDAGQPGPASSSCLQTHQSEKVGLRVHVLAPNAPRPFRTASPGVFLLQPESGPFRGMVRPV